MSQPASETQLTFANSLTIEDLRARLRNKKKTPMTCTNCLKHNATDVHHLDGNHKNNTPANITPWCKRCHNEHHEISDNLTELGILVRQFYAIQKQRMAMANRIRAYEALRYELRGAHEILDHFKSLESHTGRIVEQMVRREPIYQAYLQNIRGIGPALAASHIAIIGDPGRFPTISSLWSYYGYDVRNGKAPKRKRGEHANWSHEGRKTGWKTVGQFIKLKGCFGRKLYDQYKHFYTERDGEKTTKLHIENMTKRKVAKVFLSCLWVAWRELKGLPVSQPYAFDKLSGHSAIVTPQDWLEGNGYGPWTEEII